jgi:hypothetical protein
MKLFGREPALWINTLAAALSMFVSFGVPGMDDGRATAIVACVTAGASAWQAFHTRPVAPTLFNGVISTAAVLVAGFGLDLSQQQVGLVQAMAMTVLTLIARGQITPVADPRPLTAPLTSPPASRSTR